MSELLSDHAQHHERRTPIHVESLADFNDRVFSHFTLVFTRAITARVPSDRLVGPSLTSC